MDYGEMFGSQPNDIHHQHLFCMKKVDIHYESKCIDAKTLTKYSNNTETIKEFEIELYKKEYPYKAVRSLAYKIDVTKKNYKESAKKILYGMCDDLQEEGICYFKVQPRIRSLKLKYKLHKISDIKEGIY